MRNFVGKYFDKMIRLAVDPLRPQRLVEMRARRRILRHLGHHAAIPQNDARPLRTYFDKIDESPRIKRQRIDDRHAVSPLCAQLATEEAELQRMHAFNPGG